MHEGPKEAAGSRLGFFRVFFQMFLEKQDIKEKVEFFFFFFN